MPMKKYKPEQIVTLLRQIEVEIANRKTTPQPEPLGSVCATAETEIKIKKRWNRYQNGH